MVFFSSQYNAKFQMLAIHHNKIAELFKNFTECDLSFLNISRCDQFWAIYITRISCSLIFTNSKETFQQCDYMLKVRSPGSYFVNEEVTLGFYSILWISQVKWTFFV